MRHRRAVAQCFTGEENEKIRVTTVSAESRTIGEIAVMVVDHSSLYLEAEVMGGVFLSGLISLILTEVLFHLSNPIAEFFFHSTVWLFIPLMILIFYPCRLLFRAVPSLKFTFVGKNRRERAVKERALKAFYEKGLYKTRENTGMLIFLSLLERKVWVLADKGIHGKIHQNSLNRLASIVSKGIREGRSCEALCEAIKETGDLLAKLYPQSGVHKDQLPDDVMYDSGKEVE
jgi:putative membrane protein